MAGVDQGDRIRSLDLVTNERRVNALEDGIIQSFGALSSRLTTEFRLRPGGAISGFYTISSDGDTAQLHNSGGSIIAPGTISDVSGAGGWIRRVGTALYFTAFDFTAGKWELFSFPAGLGSRTDIGELENQGAGAMGALGNNTAFTDNTAIDVSDGSTLDTYSLGVDAASDSALYTRSATEISKFNHGATFIKTWAVPGANLIQRIMFFNGHICVLWNSTNGGNFDWHVSLYTEAGQLIVTGQFETNVAGSGRNASLAVDESGIMYIERASDGVYKIVPVLRAQTIFYKYPTASLAAKVSLGTPDSGVDVPALTAFENVPIRGNELTDIHDAIETLATFYLNAVTGELFDWTPSSADNLYTVAIGGGDDWNETGPQGAAVREDYMDEIDGCLTELEASDLA